MITVSMQEITTTLHFSSTQHFSTVVREATGMSPSEFAENPKYSVELTGLLG
jgi:AraC-like DNA-binding protein